MGGHGGRGFDLSPAAPVAAGAETALGRIARDIYTRFDAAGQGGMDFSAIIQAIRAGQEGA